MGIAAFINFQTMVIGCKIGHQVEPIALLGKL